MALAKELAITQGTLSNWLAGRFDSAAIQAAVLRRCAEIQAEAAGDEGQRAA